MGKMTNIVPRPKVTIMSQITREQRYTISVMYKQGYSQKSIAKAIDKDKSVISRELKRNRTNKGHYTFQFAQQLAEERKERFCKTRRFNEDVKRVVEKRLKEEWSPEQIVGRAKRENVLMVSVERIYQHIREDRMSGGTLYTHCRHKLKHRKRAVGKHYPIADRVDIDQRPAEVDGIRFGDWEMDTIVGKDNRGAMLTLVEKSTGFTMIKKLEKGKDALMAARAAIQLLMPYKSFVKTITTDNGCEFAQHKLIAKMLDTVVYFAHPYSSWEKGLIENTNKLYRQYIPKKSNFNDYSQMEITEIQYRINKRPRKKLNFKAPIEIFFSSLNEKVAFGS